MSGGILAGCFSCCCSVAHHQLCFMQSMETATQLLVACNTSTLCGTSVRVNTCREYSWHETGGWC